MLGDKRKANKKKTGHIRSPARPNRIMQGRLVWKSVDGTYNERLHDFFKMLTDIEDGLSQVEMAFIIFGQELNLDRKLKRNGYLDLPDDEKWKLHKFRQRVGIMFSGFRKWLENEGLVLISEKTIDGESLYYNVQKKKSIENWVRQNKKHEEGFRTTRERIQVIADQPIKSRKSKAEQLSKEIELRNRRRNKRDSGDYGYA